MRNVRSGWYNKSSKKGKRLHFYNRRFPAPPEAPGTGRRAAPLGARRAAKGGRAVTIYDIAREAGVSIATVSRVLNGSGKVGERTRRRVQAVLDSQQYIPSRVAQGLASRQTSSVGVLTVDIRDVHHSSIAYMIEQTMAGAGYSTIVCNLGGTPARLRGYLRALLSHRVNGVFFVGSVFLNEPYAQPIRELLADVPVVVVNGLLDMPNAYGVLVDECEGTRASVERLIAAGRRRIAMVCSSPTRSDENKLRGYEQAMAAHGLETVTAQCARSLAGGEEAAAGLVREHPGLDAIQFAEDITAVGGLRALSAAGLRVPQDVAVVGCNNSTYCDICTPRLSSVDNRLVEQGRAAAERMIAALQKRPAARVVRLSCAFAARETTDAPAHGE